MEGVTKEALQERLRQFEAFNQWEVENPKPERQLSAVLADLSFIRSLLPDDVRNGDPDPEKTGVQEFYRLLKQVAAFKSRTE